MTIALHKTINFGSIVSQSELPAGWRIVPNRALFDERNIRGHNNEELLSVSLLRGVTRQFDDHDRKDSSSADKSNYKLVLPNDLVYNKMRMWQGAVGVSQYRGIVSPAYIVLTPRRDVDPRFYMYLFKTRTYIGEFNRFSYGLCDDMNSLRFFDFRQIYVVRPPFDTQRAIVLFLQQNVPVFDTALAVLSFVQPWTTNEEAETIIRTVRGLLSEVVHKSELMTELQERLVETKTVQDHVATISGETTIQEQAAIVRKLASEFREALIHHAVMGNLRLAHDNRGRR